MDSVFKVACCLAFGGVFQMPVGREYPSAYLYIVAPSDGKQRLERDVMQDHIGIDSRVWLGKEIRMALHLNPSRIKDIAVEVEIGRIRIIGGPDVPNVPGEKVQMSEMQRFGRILIHIGDVGIFDFKLIDLDGIKRIDGLAPPFLVDRYFLL